ncbi:MAG: HD domain-containing phosphohydrolase [bacterium]
MSEKEIILPTNIPWNAKIRHSVKTLMDQVGNLSGISMEILHVPTNEIMLTSSAGTQDLSACSFETMEMRIGSSLILLIKGFSRNESEGTNLERVLKLLHDILKEYLQSHAEIESLSMELLENYQTLNMLYQLSEALGDIYDIERVSSIILGQAVNITHAERGSVLLLDENGTHLQVAASYGFASSELKSLTLNISDTICAEILKTGKPLIVQDIKSRPDLAIFSKGVYRTGSFISIPLYTLNDQKEKRLLGILNLSDKATAECFKSNDLKLIVAMTAQASVTIANAQSMKRLRSSKDELKKTLDELMSTYDNLEKRAVVIDQINKISLAINATLDLDKLFEKICLYAKSMTNAEDAIVYYKENSVEFKSHDQSHLSFPGIGNDSTWEDHISFSDILKSGKTFSIAKPDELVHIPLGDGRVVPLRNILAVPFFNKGDAVGVIAVVNKLFQEQFSDDDMELLQTLGNQAAIAVDNAKLIEKERVLFLDTIIALAAAVDAKDAYTHNHSTNVSVYSKAIADQMFLSRQDMEILERSAILHDIGKIAIPESILNKPDKLTKEEFDIMKTHPVCGVKIVENIQAMAAIIPGMKYHHERYDGNGYPEGRKGEEIPLLARIMAVADTYDAMTSDRPYRKGPGHEIALKEIRRCSGTQFAPEVVEAFFRSSICRKPAEVAVES